MATDALSGIAAECSVVVSDPVEVTGGLVYTATASATDIAGNTAEVSSTFTVIVDPDAPEIVAAPDRQANDVGWWNGPVTFTFSCSDAESGVASCPAPVTVDAEGAAQSFTVTAFDNAGNEGTLVVSGINVDFTAPTVEFIGARSTPRTRAPRFPIHSTYSKPV